MDATVEFSLFASDHAGMIAQAEVLFDLVWRRDFSAPGFAVLDLSPAVDSHQLRASMVALKQQLSGIAHRRGLPPFVYRSLGRFDQQVTTKFHLDGAPAESLLMLGYEPSRVRSRLFLADYSRAACDLGITPNQFLEDWNPMFQKGEERLARYTTELPQPMDGHSRIVLVNNSAQSFNEARTSVLGVLHKAVIVTPDATQRRIINSSMLVLEGDELSAAKQQEFVTTEKLSEKAY